MTERELYERRQNRANAKRQQQTQMTQSALLVLVAAVCVVMVIITAVGKKDPEPTLQASTAATTVSTEPPATEPPAPTAAPTVPVVTRPPFTWPENAKPEQILAAFMDNYGLTEEHYPKQILDAMESNGENMEYLLNFPLEYGLDHAIDLTKYDRSQGVPLLIQWDTQWGYLEYAGNYAGLSACGPTCLSMVAYYLTGDPAMTPAYVMEMAEKNGYCGNRQGSFWSLFTEGGAKLGLTVTELPLVENLIISHLNAGHPVILSVGPGAFTAGGHYIVLTDYEDGYYTVNDPNSYVRSEKKWQYKEFANQITNLWAFSV